MGHYTIIDLCWGRYGVLLNIKRHIDQRSAEFNMISLLFNNNTSMSTETIVFFTNVGYAFPAILDH